MAHGSRLVQVGFERRYDPAHQAMKASIDGGDIGAPLMSQSGHRAASVRSRYTAVMAIVDTAVHDSDVTRRLFGEEGPEVMAVTPKTSGRGGALQDPLPILLRMAGGAVVDVETGVDIDFGYDIRGAVVGETGTVELAESATVLVERGGTVGARIPADWRERVLRADDVGLQDRVDACRAGTCGGP